MAINNTLHNNKNNEKKNSHHFTSHYNNSKYIFYVCGTRNVCHPQSFVKHFSLRVFMFVIFFHDLFFKFLVIVDFLVEAIVCVILNIIRAMKKKQKKINLIQNFIVFLFISQITL